MGAIFVVMYNIFVGILHAVGDSRHPLCYLIVSTFINIGLDLLFVGAMHLDVGSAAVGALLELFRSLGKSDRVEIQVHETNSAAIHVYEKTGFETIGRAEWNKTFIVMEAKL